MRNLPTGIQSFANLRNGDYLYIGKIKEKHYAERFDDGHKVLLPAVVFSGK